MRFHFTKEDIIKANESLMNGEEVPKNKKLFSFTEKEINDAWEKVQEEIEEEGIYCFNCPYKKEYESK